MCKLLHLGFIASKQQPLRSSDQPIVVRDFFSISTYDANYIKQGTGCKTQNVSYTFWYFHGSRCIMHQGMHMEAGWDWEESIVVHYACVCEVSLGLVSITDQQ